MHNFIKIIDNPSTINSVKNLAQKIVIDSIHFNDKWIKKKSWIVVPMEGGSHMEEDDAFRISRAFSIKSFSSFYAVATEEVGEHPEVYEVPAKKEAILVFSWEKIPFNFLLIPEDGSVAVLLTHEDFYLIGGDKNFVTNVLGKSIKEARKEFWKFANEGWGEMENVRKFLTSVAKRYKNYNGK